LDTLVGEGLAGLSSGQRQRLLLARAFFGRPALLLLDEATSFLDVPSEQRIIEAIRRKRCTTIMVAHRPEVWRQADKVYDLVNCRLKCDVPLQLASV
jgi:ABC-type bacteriocin/lantibiotic exporter with double-glycine peptidase domain